MATYTSLHQTDIDKILAQYDLGSLVSMKALKGGQANSSFKLQTQCGTFVISICDEKPFSEVVTLTRVLDLLEENDFPSTRILKTLGGRPVIKVNGKPVFIKTFIEGEVPKKAEAGMIFQVGRQLARLHLIPAPTEIPQRFAYGLESFDEVIESHSDRIYRQWLAQKKDYLKKYLSEDLPKSMIHGDLFYDNMLFKDDQLIAVLDFEEVCHYYRVFDIGMCFVGFCAQDSDISMEKFKALVAGYQTETLLAPEEKQQLQAFAVLGATAASFWRFRQYNIINPDSSLQRSHLPMGRLADQLEGYSKKAFQRTLFEHPVEHKAQEQVTL